MLLVHPASSNPLQQHAPTIMAPMFEIDLLMNFSASRARKISEMMSSFLLDTYFCVNWLEKGEEDCFDVVPSKDIIPPEGVDVLDVNAGYVCRVSYSGRFYKAKVIDRGMIE